MALSLAHVSLALLSSPSVALLTICSLRLLRAAAPPDLGLFLAFAIFFAVPLGFVLTSAFTDHFRSRGLAGVLCVAGAMFASLVVSIIFLVLQHFLTNGVTFETLQVCIAAKCYRATASPRPLDHGTLCVALLGFSLGLSMGCLLVQMLAAQVLKHSMELRQLRRRVKACSPWASRPRVKVCADLADEAPGECAICLELLADRPASAAQGCCEPCCLPLPREEVAPLQLPCGHTFHEVCVSRWIASEITCPLCRKTVDDVGRCTRLLAANRPTIAEHDAAPAGEAGATTSSHQV